MAPRARRFNLDTGLRPVREATRWIFLASLVYAPWAYGTTTSETIVVLDYLLGAVVMLWIADLLLRRRLPEVPTAAAAVIGVLLLLGWWMTANARAIYDPDFHQFMAIAPKISRLPGSYDQVNSFALMIRCTLLLLSICFVADLVQRPVWLLRLWWTIAIAGGSIALFGLLEKGLGARMIFWGDWPGREAPTFFATYFYHANAGAFLNLVFSLTAGLAGRAVINRQPPGIRAASLTAGILVLVAIVANTSRAAQVIGIGLILLLAALSLQKVRRMLATTEKFPIAIGTVVMALAIFSVAQASRLDQPIKRWGQLSVFQDERWAAVQTARPAARDANWFGFGPGTFRSIFPHYVAAPGSNVTGTWRFLHQDYLQTIIEWGWIGAVMWALLLFGGMSVGLRALRQKAKSWIPRQRMFLPLALLALLGVAVHALVDFPFQIASLQLYVTTYLGVCWGSVRWGGEGEVGSRKSEVRRKK